MLAALLILGTLLAYMPAWKGAPIWDDDAHMTRPELRSLEGLARIWIEPGATQQYYPLVYTAFWLEQRLWGESTLGYHVVSILLHASSALLLVRILRYLRISGTWLAAAIFALHPVQVESVAWISELKNTLSGVLYLAAALAYLRFSQHRKAGLYILSLGLFVLSLLSKTVVATLPAALLVVEWWRTGRLSWRRHVVPLVPFFLLAVLGGGFTAWFERVHVGAQGDLFHLSMTERGLIASRAIWFYLAKLCWPVNLVFSYPRWQVSAAVWWQYLFPLGIVGLVIVLWQFSRYGRGALAGFLFFAGSLFPALGFLDVYPFRYSFVADHFQYLSCLGIIVAAAAGATLGLRACMESPGFDEFGKLDHDE